jgi:tRNA nucleotidyltransferase (CCA-adding enzyme)
MQAFQKHNQWTAVKDLCQRLKESGYQTLLAGGCVRDLLMGREPNDFDIATSATPDQIEALFPKSLNVGKAFGVIILPFDNFQLEVATFREDLEYKDGRRPEGVKFSTPEADAKRRDFTVNALFVDPDTGQIIDYVGGEADIKRRLIKTVGDAKARFNEDKLRLMRAVRFAAQLDFEIDPATYQAVTEMASQVTVVSRERIRDELLKLIQAKENVKGLKLLRDTGLLKAIFPQIAPVLLQNEEEWLKPFTHDTNEKDGAIEARLALFFAPVYCNPPPGVPPLRDFLKELRIDNKRMDVIVSVLSHRDDWTHPQKLRKGELLTRLYDRVGTAPIGLRMARALDPAGEPERAKFIAQVKAQMPALPQAFLNGEDLKKAGVSAGSRMGELLRESYLLQLEETLKSKDEALDWIKSK